MRATVKIGIIGAGELGRAMGLAFGRANIPVLFYDKDPEKTAAATVAEVVQTCHVILLCVPSWANKEAAKAIAKASHDHESKIVISFSKGIERHFGTMEQILAEHLPKHYSYGLLYGPTLAEEIAAGRLSAGMLAVSNTMWQDSLQKLFAKAHLSVDYTNDLRSTAICGVLKNVYAIAFGMNDGLHLGDNAKGKLAVRTLKEMKQVLKDLNADPVMADSLAGIGDLLTTGLGDSSFNYRVGKTIAEGIASTRVKSEGLVALEELSKAQALDIRKYPILNLLNQTVYHYAPCSDLLVLLQDS